MGNKPSHTKPFMQGHRVSDGAYTGWGSSHNKAKAAYEEAKRTNREYIQYTVYPKDDGIIFKWNHYGPKRK